MAEERSGAGLTRRGLFGAGVALALAAVAPKRKPEPQVGTWLGVRYIELNVAPPGFVPKFVPLRRRAVYPKARISAQSLKASRAAQRVLRFG